MVASLALFALLAPIPAPQIEDGLALTPADAVLALHLDDFEALRGQIAQNDYYRFLTDPEGLMGVFGEQVPDEIRALLSLDPTDEELAALGEEEQRLFTLLHSIEGSATLYLTNATPGQEPVLGLLLEPGDRMPRFAEVVSQIADESGEVSMMERGSLRVGVPTRSLTGQGGFEAGMIFSADRFAMVAGDDDAAVRAEFERVADRMSGNAAASLLDNERFAEARRALSTQGQIDFFVDLGAMTSWIEEIPAQPGQPSPQEVLGQLGVDRMRWIAGRAGIGSGENMDLEVQVHVPHGSILGSLADLFGPLPPTLVERIPADAVAVTAGNFNLAGLFDLSLDTVEELAEGMGEMARMQIEQFSSMLGVDLEADLLEQFTGGFASYSIPAREVDFESDPMAAMMMSSGLATAWVAELYDADLVADSVEGLIGFAGGMMGGGDIPLDTMTVAGFDLLRPADLPVVFGFGQGSGTDALAIGLEPDMVAELLRDPADRKRSILDNEQLGPLVEQSRNVSTFQASITAQTMKSVRSGFLNFFPQFAAEMGDEGPDFVQILESIDPQMIDRYFQGVSISTLERLPHTVRMHYRTR